MTAIEVTKITKRVGNFTAVDDLSFKVKDEEIFGLLGSNGAGKTTVINMLSGLLLPTKGSIHISNHDVRTDMDKIRKIISLVPQTISLYDDLTILENMDFFGRIYLQDRQKLRQKMEEMISLFQLQNMKNRLMKNLSGGYQRRTSIAIALLHEPKLLFLDEPTVGIDLATNQIIMDFIRKSGTTIILTTHSIREAEAISDRILFMDKGKKIIEGSPRDITEKYSEEIGEKIIVYLKQSHVDKFVKDLSRQKNVSHVNPKGSVVEFSLDKASNVVEIVHFLYQNKEYIKDFDIEKPGLEQVFLKMMKHEHN